MKWKITEPSQPHTQTHKNLKFNCTNLNPTLKLKRIVLTFKGNSRHLSLLNKRHNKWQLLYLDQLLPWSSLLTSNAMQSLHVLFDCICSSFWYAFREQAIHMWCFNWMVRLLKARQNGGEQCIRTKILHCV